MDYMSRGNRAKAKRLGSAISKLEQEHGGNIRQGSLCAEMQMTEKELAELQEDVREVRLVSLDEDQGEAEDQSLHDMIPDHSSVSALEVLDRKGVLSLLAQRMAKLYGDMRSQHNDGRVFETASLGQTLKWRTRVKKFWVEMLASATKNPIPLEPPQQKMDTL